MKLDEVKASAKLLYALAEKHGIAKIYICGSVARGESGRQSDVDFLVEMKPDASLFGVPGFLYDAEQLLGVSVDVIPLSVLSEVDDQEFAVNFQQDAIAL